MEPIEIRDHRNKEWFWIDDEYLNGYSRLLKPASTLVYLALCRHANKEQKSWPSIELLCEKLGLSNKTVISGIKELEEWRLIIVSRSKNEETKRQNPNVYVLTNKKNWRPKPGVENTHGTEAECSPRPEPGVNDDQKPGVKSTLEVNTVISKHIEGESHTPKERAQNFFADTDSQNRVAEWLIGKGLSERVVRAEVAKFVSYWTEPNGSGTKQRWQMEPVFDIQRRFQTWFSRIKTAPAGRTRKIWK